MRGDRSLYQARQRLDFFARPICSCADNYQRVSCLPDKLGRFGNAFRVRRGRPRNTSVDIEVDVGRQLIDVPGRLDRGRTNAPGMHAPESLGNNPGRFARIVDPLGIAGEAAHRRQLIRQLVELSPSLADQVRHDVARDAE